MRKRVRYFRNALGAVAIALATLSLLFGLYRLAYPDFLFGKSDWDLLDPLFYAAQWPILILGLLPAVWISARRRWYRLFVPTLGLSVVMETTRKAMGFVSDSNHNFK